MTVGPTSIRSARSSTLVGKPPFAGETVASQIHAHLSEPPLGPSDHDSSLVGFDSLGLADDVIHLVELCNIYRSCDVRTEAMAPDYPQQARIR